MADTAIQWTNKVWNPTTGCDRVSPGCDNCYALTMAKRLKGMGSARYQTDGDPRTSGPGFGLAMHPSALDLPLTVRKPQRWFVNSMSDLFHPRVTDQFIAQVFAVMAAAQRHTFQILTKRPARMRALLGGSDGSGHRLLEAAPDEATAAALYQQWPLPNVWLVVSAETQEYADSRIPLLMETPAAVRGVSAEPLLGPVDLSPWTTWRDGSLRSSEPDAGIAGLDWVIVGGESGPKARPMQLAWARALRDQCTQAGVPFFFKQWGAFAPLDPDVATGREIRAYPGELLRKAGAKLAGRVLDGRTWDEYPGEDDRA
jgi:protein gp37